MMLFVSSATFTYAQKEKVTKGEDRLKAYDLHKEMKEKSSFKDFKWSFIGPTNISGRVTDVEVVAPKGKNYTIYAAAASGGVWRTDNEGVSWYPIFENQATSSIGDIALDPQNSEVLWVGTGEANIFRSSMAGCGIFKTADGGKTWKHMGLHNTNTIARILIHPENSNIVYVAASGHEWTKNKERGVYKTTDGGKSWKKILYVDDLTGAIDLVMDPSDPETVYAATWQRIRKKWNDPRTLKNYSKSGIYKTTNGGKNWKKINKGLPEGKHRGRIGIDIARSNPNVIYAFVDCYELVKAKEGEIDSYGRKKKGYIKGAQVYRSDDKGANWTLMSGQTDKMKTYMERHSATYGWVFGQMRVDPNDENTIYTMGLRLNVSNDAGKTFRQLNGMHADHHGLWIDPDNSDYLVNANDGGVSVSYDGGKNWKSFTDNLPIIQFYNVGFDMADPFKVYGSVQDHGSYRGTVMKMGNRFRAVEFERAPGWEDSHHVISPEDENLVYAASFYGAINRTYYKPGKKYSWGDTESIMPKIFDDEPKLRGQWMAPFMLSPHNPDIVYHGMQYLFRSKDKGDTWEKISPDLSLNDKTKMGDIPFQTLTAISESSLMYGILYAGTDDGQLHVSKDGGKNWKLITNGLENGRWISRVIASKYDMSSVYATQNGKRDDDFTAYVWKSEDYGTTWKDISGNIPFGPVNVIREHPFRKGVLFVGTDTGVYVSEDDGKNWEVLGDLPSCYVHDLIYHSKHNVIVVATHGRGMFALDATKLLQKKK